ncbi:Gfo/Idh/MocA family protein [Agarivorans sp. JK6]|uniref:Gfo/Idh/MocA family protein n=1 Tax=Agarivorans sp. JK6 TaxID=2997426 RepID=UPI003872D896
MFEKVAVIGLGNIAVRHRRNLKFLYPDAYLYGMSASGRIPSEEVSDCDEIVSSVSELIQIGVELAIVASPAPFHAEHSIELINSGIPILIEKPLTVSLSDCELIHSAINNSHTPVAVGYCLRYLPSLMTLRDILDRKTIGTIYNAHVEIGQYLPDWRPNKCYKESVSANSELGGGALNELSHELDYAQLLFGALSVNHAVLRSSQELGLAVEDCVDIVASNEDSALINIHLDFLQRSAYRRCRIVGSRGALLLDLIKNELVMTTENGSQVLFSEPSWDKNQMYLNMLRDFEAQIQGREHQTVSVIEAMQSVALVQQVKDRFPIL